jgi:peptidoglycan hydrolase-like protein with peptidoglycan-binding domain
MADPPRIRRVPKPKPGPAAPLEETESREHPVLGIQQAAGNRAVAGLVADRAASKGAPVQRTGDRTLGGLASVQRQVPAAGAVAAPHQVLRAGTHGEEVKQAQRKLSRVQASALPLTEDGTYGGLTTAAVRSFQTTAGVVPANGVLTLDTWARLDTAFAALPPPVRTVLAPGADHPDVGFAQQKLNAVGASPRLVVNGVYDAAMAAPVLVIELAVLHRVPTGIIDAEFWTALDRAVAGGFVALEGASATAVEQHTPSGTADARGVQTAGTSLHPVVGAGGVTNGNSVRELQQKLNTAGASPVLRVDGAFGTKTTTALQAFQGARVPPLPATGVADAATWAAVDAASPGSTVGFVERRWGEEVGGARYGLTSRYSFQVTDTRVLISVKVNFTGLAPPGAWFGHVPAVWNKYQAVRDAPTRKVLPIDFEMIRGTGPEAMTIAVVAGTGRANAGRWFVGDTNAASTVPHEYGHLVGLQDEYQLHPGDYVRVTGHEPPVGQVAAPPGQTPATVATALQTAIAARNDVNARGAVAGLTSGAWAQRVVAAYATLPSVNMPALPAVVGPPPHPARAAAASTGNLVRDLETSLRDTIDKYETIQVLTHSSGSIMGDPGRVTDVHDHGAQPRHVAEFVAITGRALGGTWRAEAR